MALVRAVLRSVKTAGCFAWYGAELLFRRPATRQQRADWLHRFCADALKGVGITVTVEGAYPESGALISNHVGYLDIVTYAALHPCVFCSKAEIQHWPFMGWLATMAGTVFVERGAGGSALKAASGMQAAVDAGIPVTFFPEGTTTNGEELLPFRSGLLAQVLMAGAPVTAAYIRYRLTEDNGPHVKIADDVCYWGETPLLGHIFKLLGLRGVHVEVRFAPGPIAFVHGSDDRREAAIEAHAAVLELARESGVEFVVNPVVPV